MNVHAWFDIAAATAAAVMTVGCFFWRLRAAAARIDQAGFGYAAARVAGAAGDLCDRSRPRGSSLSRRGGEKNSPQRLEDRIIGHGGRFSWRACCACCW